MNICLFSPDEIEKPLPNSDSRARHILDILHKKSGDTFEAGIIGGNAGTALIESVSESGISFSFKATSAGKRLYPLTLIIGFPRPIQLRRLLRDVAGLGVQKIILTGTELTEKSYLSSNIVRDGSAEQMLLEGTIQAASTHIPRLETHRSLAETLDSVRPATESAAKIALDNRRPEKSLHDFLQIESALSVVAAIGSERGWTDNERTLLAANGFTLCSMGNRILRTETAATTASAIILDALGCLN